MATAHAIASSDRNANDHEHERGETSSHTLLKINTNTNALTPNPPASRPSAVNPAQDSPRSSANISHSKFSLAAESTAPKTPLTPFRSSLGAAEGPPPSPSPSLTATRPAPPSPAESRRTSQVGSTASGSRRYSRRTSGPSNRNSAVRLSRLSYSISFNPDASSPSKSLLPSLSPSVVQRTLTIRIRDFAFLSSDDKHFGLGPDVPRTNRPKHLLRLLNAHLRNSTMSTASSVVTEDVDEEFDEDEDLDGWDDEGYSSILQANVSVSSPATFEYEAEDEDEEAGSPPPLYPGIYRALYAFTPEGPSEKALEEGEEVRVLGRGGGNGWAVVLVEETDDSDEKAGKTGTVNLKQALVPESYLELVAVDPEYEEQLKEYIQSHRLSGYANEGEGV